MKLRSVLPAALFLAACSPNAQNHNVPDNAGWAPPPAGTVVAADSMMAANELNQFYFAVKLSVSAANDSAQGDYGFIYDLSTHCGPGDLKGIITMPPGGKALKPLLQKAPGQEYKYIIGFIAGKDLGGDGRTFQELYSVAANKGAIEIAPLKTYRFK